MRQDTVLSKQGGTHKGECEWAKIKLGTRAVDAMSRGMRDARAPVNALARRREQEQEAQTGSSRLFKRFYAPNDLPMCSAGATLSASVPALAVTIAHFHAAPYEQREAVKLVADASWGRPIKRRHVSMVE